MLVLREWFKEYLYSILILLPARSIAYTKQTSQLCSGLGHHWSTTSVHYTHIVQPVNDIGVSVWPLAILILALFGCWLSWGEQSNNFISPFHEYGEYSEWNVCRWNKIIILIETYLWESRAGGIIWFSPQETLNINDSLMYKLILDWTKGKSFLFRFVLHNSPNPIWYCQILF